MTTRTNSRIAKKACRTTVGQIELEEAGEEIDDPEQGDARERRTGRPGP